MKTTSFKKDIKRGKSGEAIFIKDFLVFNGIEFEDVTDCQRFRLIDTDLVVPYGKVEVKANYKDNRKIIVEEYTNVNQNLGKVTKGWFDKSEAGLFIFVSTDTRTMVFLPNTDEFHSWYEKNSEKYTLYKNKITTNHNGDKWQSAFRIIPLSDIKGYYAFYQKSGN